jgi:DNA-directed RNA polymerase specialized sigma24 family protein
MPAPKLSDEPAWRDIIARRAFHEFTPEELLAVYDTRSASSNATVVWRIEKYLLLVIDRVISARLGYGDARNGISEAKHLARNAIHDALMLPNSEDGKALRKFFNYTITVRCVDAARKRTHYEERFLSLEVFDNELIDDGNEPQQYEDRLVQSIDIERMTRVEAHAGRRLAREMVLRGYTQEEIALATGVNVRQVRRWLKSFRTSNDSN